MEIRASGVIQGFRETFVSLGFYLVSVSRKPVGNSKFL